MRSWFAALASADRRQLRTKFAKHRRHLQMNRTLLPIIVVTLIVAVAGLDLWTPAELIGSVLFTLPLALCALQPSQRLLWGTAAAACLVTVVAEFRGFSRVDDLISQAGSINRGLVVASLLTLTTFIHLWINKGRKVVLDTLEIQRQRTALVAQNEQLEALVTTANRNISLRKAAAEYLAQVESGRRLTEQALRESEERYRMILDGVQDHAIFMMDPQGQIVSWNAGAERIKGYRADEIIGCNFSRFFPAEDIEQGKPEQILRMTIASGRHEEQAMRVRKDGSQFLASVTFTALRDQAGNLRGFSEFSRDLSKSKESEAKYRGLLEAAPDAMVVVNQDGEIVLLNVQAEQQFGYHRNELVGQQVKNIIPQGFAERLVADALRSGADALAQQIGTGIELAGRRKDGSEFPIEIMLSPLQSTEGMLVTAAIRNISVRKQAEKHVAQMVLELSLKHQLLDSVVEGTPDLIYVRDLENRFTLANGACAKLFGRTAIQMVGISLRELLPEDSFRAVALSDQEVVNAGVPRVIEESAEVEGLHRIFLTTKGPYRDADQKIIGTIGIGRDITERRRLDEARVEELKRDLRMRKETEEHLARMEGRYRGLLEAAPDAMVVVNQGGGIVLLNVQAEKQFGYRRYELLGQQVKNIIPEGFAERLLTDALRSAADALAQQIGTGIELTGRRKDGSEFPIEIMLSPLASPEGTLVTAAIRDISVRKAAEEHLGRMEGRYRGLLEAAPDAMVVVDQHGGIILLNLQAEKQFGYPRDELLGQQVKNIIPEGFAQRLLADALRSREDMLAQQIGTGIELTGRRKNGSDFPIEIMLSPLESTEGILVTAAIRDISVRKDAEKHLAQMESRYRGLLEAAPDAMVVVNQCGEIVLLNVQAEKQFGYRRDELLGQEVKNIIPEGFAERLLTDALRSAADALAQQIGTGIELTGQRKDGSEFPIEIMLSPLESSEGTLVTAAIRDITTRKTAEVHLLKTIGELKRSNDELEHFAYVASHDLQEPLRMVASYTQLLAKRYIGRLDADADEFIAYAVDGSNRMQSMIQDLLAYSRAGANSKTPRRISSESALQEALANLRMAIEESGAVVTHDPLPVFTTDQAQLTQVFQNLVGNAIKYRRAEAPRVHVSANNGGSEWVFSVHDNGLGIDPQYFARIFVLFQRLHGREEFDGTGIGLAICKKMLERLGGRIWVESQPKQGSTFYFALPEGA